MKAQVSVVALGRDEIEKAFRRGKGTKGETNERESEPGRAQPQCLQQTQVASRRTDQPEIRHGLASPLLSDDRRWKTNVQIESVFLLVTALSCFITSEIRSTVD